MDTLSKGPEKKKAEQPDMEAFRKKIRSLIVERQNDESIENMRDLRYVDLEKLIDLTEEDALMFDKLENYKKGSVSQRDCMEYQAHVIASGNRNRDPFASAVVNGLQVILVNEQSEERERKRATPDEA